MRKLAFVLLAALALASCASIQRSRDRGNIERIAALINSGQAEKLAGMSELPFLLDQEIILLEQDVRTFWSTIAEVGFKVEEPVLERGARITDNSYREFYDSMEVRTFFDRYLKKRTRLLELKTGTGRSILLLLTGAGANRTIHGFKGPF